MFGPVRGENWWKNCWQQAKNFHLMRALYNYSVIRLVKPSVWPIFCATKSFSQPASEFGWVWMLLIRFHSLFSVRHTSVPDFLEQLTSNILSIAQMKLVWSDFPKNENIHLKMKYIELLYYNRKLQGKLKKFKVNASCSWPIDSNQRNFGRELSHIWTILVLWHCNIAMLLGNVLDDASQKGLR